MDFLRPLFNLIPEIGSPDRRVPLKEKLMWTLGAVLLYFVMGEILPIGAAPSQQARLELLSLLGSKVGSIISLGIGPIVTASIILQLLVGSGILNINTSTPEGRSLYQGLYKSFAIFMCFVENAAYVASGLFVVTNFWLVVLQMALGSIILLYLDEIVSKYGIGSGISLFIAAGISQSIVTTMFTPAVDVAGRPVGILFSLIYSFSTGAPELSLLFPIAAFVLIFASVVFAESMRVDIPISHSMVRGYGGTYPLKFMYVSNLPVILAFAFLQNVFMWGYILQSKFGLSIIGKFNGLNPTSGFAYLISPSSNALNPFYMNSAFFNLGELAHFFGYLTSMVLLCVVFGVFWIDVGGSSAASIAEQLSNMNLTITGFRRDKRIMESILQKYIPTLAIVSSIAVGLIAVFADSLGVSVLGTSGTGILLTVGILYNFYRTLVNEQAMDMFPALRTFLGGK